MGADPFRKLVTSHVPSLDPMSLMVIKRHARDLVNGRKCDRDDWQEFVSGSSSQGRVVGARTGTSLSKPWPVRFWREGTNQQPSEDRIDGHVEQIATRRATLHSLHHCELPSSCAGMLDVCGGICMYPLRSDCNFSGTPARSNTVKIHLWSTLGQAQEKSVSKMPGSSE